MKREGSMISKIKTLILLAVLFLFDGCTSNIRYSSQIVNYDYYKFDGVLIYNRNPDIMIFNLFRSKDRNLVFVNDNLQIIKKPNNYSLKDKEIISLIKAYKELHLSYCRVDYDKIIRVICNGIDYVKINKKYDDKVYLFNEHIQEYKYIDNDWYIKNRY